MKIGFLDSGVGGITVLYRAVKMLPDADFLYYADVDHVPYGTKSKEELIEYVDHAISFMINLGAEAVVIACNTATSAAAEYVRKKYEIPIIGMEPAVKPALEHCNGLPVLLMATPLTVHEEKLRVLLEHYDRQHLVTALEMPKLVQFAENSDFDSEEVQNYIGQQMKPYSQTPFAAIVFGCTHFGYFKEVFSHMIPTVTYFADGGEGTVRHLRQVLQEQCGYCPDGHQGSITYFESDRPVSESEKERLDSYLIQASK